NANTERDRSVHHSAFIIQRLGESGRACSSPRQWKHGHERARLTPKTERVLSRLQKIHARKSGSAILSATLTFCKPTRSDLGGTTFDLIEPKVIMSRIGERVRRFSALG